MPSLRVMFRIAFELAQTRLADGNGLNDIQRTAMICKKVGAVTLDRTRAEHELA
jgi:hypothetical protein